MQRTIKWNRACKQINGDSLYLSKCGRFRIRQVRFASGRGFFNTIAYKLISADGAAEVEADTLANAKDEAEYLNNPDWEPA
jgi:hypothetical protein